MEKTLDKRNSSIELLKIIGMYLIVSGHSTPGYGLETADSYVDFTYATNDIQILLVVIFRYIAQMGNVIFIVASAFFLQESKKLRPAKVLSLLIDAWIISMAFLILFSLMGYPLTVIEICKQFLPVAFGNNWFIGCYLLFYLIHPFLNIVLQSMNQKTLLYVNIFNFIVYCCAQFVLPIACYYNFLVGFIVIYFMVAYLKLYMEDFSKSFKKNMGIFLLATVGQIILVLIWNYLGLKSDLFADKLQQWWTFINPFSVLMGLSIFNLFRQKYFVNQKINYLSSLCLLIYMIHENMLVRTYIRPAYFAYVYHRYTYAYLMLEVLVLGALSFVISLAIGTLYEKIIQKPVQKMINRCLERKKTC